MARTRFDVHQGIGHPRALETPVDRVEAGRALRMVGSGVVTTEAFVLVDQHRHTEMVPASPPCDPRVAYPRTPGRPRDPPGLRHRRAEGEPGRPDDRMSLRQTLTLGNQRFRVGPWHADVDTAYLSLTPNVVRPSTESLSRCVRRLAGLGYTSIITAALHPEEAQSFLANGFVEHDRLHVLAHPLTGLDRFADAGPDGLRLRRARRGDRRRALEIDARAFPPFWRLDATGLDEAEHATPRRRFRVAAVGGEPVGYAVTGRAGSQGFLQRLATDPGHSGQGIGSRLVLDALQWAAQRGVRRVLVNTQWSNDRALALYRHLGFESTATDLVVLMRRLP